MKQHAECLGHRLYLHKMLLFEHADTYTLVDCSPYIGQKVIGNKMGIITSENYVYWKVVTH